ncbi:MAG: hypothetical protein U9N81_06995 [Bacillota bacterium]|nr:hypothetical protein [Bacillota bacterium]
MNGIGHAAYILLGHMPDKQIKYEAHIYTDVELKAFFNGAAEQGGTAVKAGDLMG